MDQPAASTAGERLEAPPDVAPSAPPTAALEAGPRYLNRELQWLEFNRRVLHEALDERTPLMERVRFLSIYNSNLDEFFMKRVGGLCRQRAAGLLSRTADGRTPQEQLQAIRRAVEPQLVKLAECFQQSLHPALTANGVHLLEWSQLADAERQRARAYFRANVFPVLTPLAVDPGHPFPFISNLTTSLGVMLRHPDREEKLFARVKVPDVLPAWVRVNAAEDGGHRFLRLADLIRHNLQDLFPNMVLLGVMPFRVTRNADVEHDEDDAEDLLEMVEEELRQRRFARAVRLEHGPHPHPWILKVLVDQLELADDDVYEMPVELDYTSLGQIADLNLPALKYRPHVPAVPPLLGDEDLDLFSTIRNGDVLVHMPYESFNASVERFILAAADDPKVLAIKMTVYRTGENSPFIHALVRAAQSGKQVVCLVELKARFDEERNIYWAHQLEKVGVHVVYGVVGLKTHNKTALVVRQEPEGLRLYAHIGTGNYNSTTARLYTDLGLLTCRLEITEDLVEVFHFLTGRSLKREYRKLLVAPVTMRDRFLEMIRREAAHARDGRPAQIYAKMNQLEDGPVIEALYEASQAGVNIDLVVRGFCCLRPGVPGMSERIRVSSVIGRFLEHSRIYFFRNGAEDPLDGDFFIGSADWMYRNLSSRVEVVAPIEGRALRERLWEILQVMRRDQRQAWDMHPDGTYVQRTPPHDSEGPEAAGTHQALINLARKRAGL